MYPGLLDSGVGHASVVNSQAVHVCGGQDYLLMLVDDRQVPREVLLRHPEVGGGAGGLL